MRGGCEIFDKNFERFIIDICEKTAPQGNPHLDTCRQAGALCDLPLTWTSLSRQNK